MEPISVNYGKPSSHIDNVKHSKHIQLKSVPQVGRN